MSTEPEHNTASEDTSFFADADTEVSIPSPNDPVSPIPVLPQLSVALGLLVFVFGVTYIGATSTLSKKPVEEDVRVETALAKQTQKAWTLSSIFNDTEIRAKSAIVWDVEKQRVLFNKNADEQLPLASITKLMTALVSYEIFDPEKRITVPASAIQTDGDSGLREGEEFTVQELTDLTLIVSSNDGAAALGTVVGDAIDTEKDAEAVFVRAMNLRAEELGLTQTYFKNTTGLDVSESEAGGYGSARDVALLTEYMLTNVPDALALTKEEVATIKSVSGEYHRAKNTNEVIDTIQGLIASKTGYTRLAGGNLAVAFNAGLNRPIIVVVLGSSQEGRFSDTLDLIEKTRTYIENDAE
jgi:serine-type D-Ala-D-Ala carboxypeptidase (penicillin-binding protein 5/6)